MSSRSGKLLSESRRVPTNGFLVSDGIEWKISKANTDSCRGSVKGSVNFSYHTGRVDPESSALVAMRLVGSTQKTQ